MLSYRHAFHAGSFADVLKHAVLVQVLRHVTRKPQPIYVLDTHAGAGWYGLDSPMAQKTSEFRDGIGRLLAIPAPWPELLAPYLELVRATNQPGELRSYPGSPALARAMLRLHDRLELVELHGTDHGLLAESVGRAPGVRVVREDGLAALVLRMPPPERRAVVLVDPSWEIKSDYDAVPRALARAHRRFPTGIYLLWYPVIERVRVEALLAALHATGIPAQFRLELGLRPDAPGLGMTGCGLIVINPPWTLLEAAMTGLPWLAGALGATGGATIDWLTPQAQKITWA